MARELPQEFSEMTQDAKSRILGGVMNFVLSSLLYALGLYLAVRVLKSADAISWNLSWTQCTSLIVGFNFIRVWDRALMR